MTTANDTQSLSPYGAAAHALETDLQRYECWAQDLGYRQCAVESDTAESRARQLFDWLDAHRARLRAFRSVFVPAVGPALDPRGAAVLAVVRLEQEFAEHGFLDAQQDPLEFELFIHDLDDLLSSEPEFTPAVFDVLQDDLELLVQALSGFEPGETPLESLENVFLRLSAVLVRWLELNPVFGPL